MVGFDTRNKGTLDSKFICPVCSLILRDPVQLNTCGHRQCQSCFDVETRTTTNCPWCSTERQRAQMWFDRGFKNDMESLPINCAFCEWSGVLKNYQEHLDQFHQSPICEYCIKQCNSVNELNEHKVFECQEMPIHCPMKVFGCNEPIIRGKMEDHYLTRQHMQSLLKIAHQMESHSLSSETTAEASRTTSATAPWQELHETSSTLERCSETMNDGGQRLSNGSSQSQANIKLSEEESCACMEDVEHNQDSTSLKEKINDMQYVSYDGTLIWKITKFQEKMEKNRVQHFTYRIYRVMSDEEYTNAQSERQTSIYSPAFYSSPTGYKMCAQLYLHGDGNARRTHMSLFFVLMRSQHDKILKFPFSYKVTFCLYDQSDAQKHIIDSFRPDIRSNSFQRPRSDMNMAIGIPKFCPLATIQREGNPYVRDDTMFIKVMVDFGDMSKTLLSYALSLNPGIPNTIQQAMIQEEEKRRAQPKRS